MWLRSPTLERVEQFIWLRLGLGKADRFSMVIVQNVDGVAVEDGDDGADELGGDNLGNNNRYEEEGTRKGTQNRKAQDSSQRAKTTRS